jgi:alpha-glucosidase
MAVAEAWVPGERRVLYARPDELGQAFNFEYLRAPWDGGALREVITASLDQARAAGASATWVLSNHDVIRHATRLALPPGADPDAWLLSDGREPAVDAELGLRRARAATLLMLALPGSAYLYQGEELGLPEVADLPAEALRDPIWEQTGHARKGRDGCRVPLPWTRDGADFGFGPASGAGASAASSAAAASGSGRPWLPQPEFFSGLSVEAQDGVEDSTLELYRAALRIRRGVLSADESLTWLDGPDPGVLQFARPGGWRVVANTTSAAVPLPAGRVLLASGPLDGSATELPPDTTVWLKA